MSKKKSSDKKYYEFVMGYLRLFQSTVQHNFLRINYNLRIDKKIHVCLYAVMRFFH